MGLAGRRRRVHALSLITTVTYYLSPETREVLRAPRDAPRRSHHDPRKDVTPPLHGNFGSLHDRQTPAAKTPPLFTAQWRGSRIAVRGRKRTAPLPTTQRRQVCPRIDRTCVVRRAREAGGSLPGRERNDPWNEHWKRRLAVGQPRGHRRRTRLARVLRPLVRRSPKRRRHAVRETEMQHLAVRASRTTERSTTSVEAGKKGNPYEAATGFDNLTNGFDLQGLAIQSLTADRTCRAEILQRQSHSSSKEIETTADGLGPTTTRRAAASVTRTS